MSTFPEYHRQQSYGVRFDWGIVGAEAVCADVNVVVDVLSFTTSVCIAVERGMAVYPFAWKNERAQAFAATKDATLAVGRRQVKTAQEGPSLSPANLAACPYSSRIVLPSPNGSTISAKLAREGQEVVAGCLRNAAAVGQYLAAKHRDGASVAVVASGEKWRSDRSLRPSVEDHLGAGAILYHLLECDEPKRVDGQGDQHTSSEPVYYRCDRDSFSPESIAAASMYSAVQESIATLVGRSASGEELTASGFAEDVEYAQQVNVSQSVPIMCDGAFAAR